MRRNQYRAWAGDKRVWSQVKEIAPITCESCKKVIDIRMELIVESKCEECQKAQAAK